ncbi:MAG: ATP-binding protein [Lachnospiraceae bacterium]|nr:ATP-binding protein [Lachnospiraceae bacterium]
MKRQIFDKLVKWKENPNKKPLVLEGARQVGKTYIVREFGEKEYKKFAYFNFDGNIALRNIFEMDYNVDRILMALSAEIGFKIDEDTLVFFDEVQVCGKAITSLKYFCEEKRNLHVIAAGSLLGLSYSDGTGFPVGKVEFLKMYPLSFREYLLAEKEDLLVEILDKRDYELIRALKNKLEKYFKIYCFVGGMPEVVENFIINKDFEYVRKIQNSILKSYDLDFSKHARNGQLEKIRMIWNAIPTELAKDNKKFKYSDLKKNSRAKDFENAIQFLKDAGLIYTINNIKKFQIPITSYVDNSCFKMYMLDVGLLSNMNHVSAKIINSENDLFVEYKGSIAEQFVLTELLCCGEDNVTYHIDENSRNQIDFIIEQDGNIVPIEVKSGINLKSKSLNNTILKYNIKKAIRYSLADYKQNDIVEDIPIYSI